MFSPYKQLYFCVILNVLILKSCWSELVMTPSLVLYSPGDPEYTDVLVKRVHDNLTLVCELRGDTTQRSYVWNYVGDNGTRLMGQRSLSVTPVGPASSSTLQKTDLRLFDSGQYMCSVPPFSVTKYVLVQTRGPVQCARGAFWCGARCVLLAYVCDGRRDCLYGEDEDGSMCDANICSRPDKLNCSSGRCISASACCRGSAPLCRQPACCDEFTSRTQLEGYVEAEFPPLFEDRHAPDDYGFIQSTIYTVTACALIFMIAVVLLVSAICKMQMKRAALRGYTHADRTTSSHYSAHYHQAARFPPCYEAALLEPEGRPLSPPRSPSHGAPARDTQSTSAPPAEPRGLARLSAIFSSRYRQVPTQPPDVEMTNVRPNSTPTSPSHPPLVDYRSPTYCDLNTEFIFANPESPELGRDLNYMATPVEFFRRRTMRRNTLERVMDQLDRQRMTLQLGRFQLSIPRLGRGGPRPDTPVVELDALDLVSDTYTLNGRTIRLLGADLHPPAPPPPPYSALRYKLYGPPPEYLSREALNRRSADAVDEEAASNVEMPPQYDDLTTSDVINGNSDVINGNSVTGNNEDNTVGTASAVINSDNANGNICTSTVVTEIVPVHSTISLQNNVTNSNVETLSSIIDNLPAIDSDVNANDPETGVVNDHVVCDNVINSTVINV